MEAGRKNMRVETTGDLTGRHYHLYKEQECIGRATLTGTLLGELWVVPRWRGKGYGSYLLKELLRANGGFDPAAETCFTAPLPDGENAAAWALAGRFGFVRSGEQLRRLRVPDLTAVELSHRLLRSLLPAGGLYLDATCGNGHDTLFLCELAGPQGHVIGLDIQPMAVQATNTRLARHGMEHIGQAILSDHRDLLRFAPAGSADCVMFNFGWLPGSAHQIHSQAEASLQAVRAALEALRPGGVLSAVLYSGKVIGQAEKQAVLAFLESLPLTEYTVLVSRFANWADTAPLPCLVIKRPSGR